MPQTPKAAWVSLGGLRERVNDSWFRLGIGLRVDPTELQTAGNQADRLRIQASEALEWEGSEIDATCPGRSGQGTPLPRRFTRRIGS